MTVQSLGQLVVSIDLELNDHASSVAHQRRLDTLAGALRQSLATHQIPATIAVSDPVHSAATELFAQSSLPHEIAILGEPSWVGRGAGRERFGRELQRRFQSARAAGLAATSLVLRQVELAENFDLLVKNGVTAIRSDRPVAPSPLPQPQWLRFGLWQVPTSTTLPANRSWWFASPARSACRQLRQAAASRTVFHLRVDGGQLAESDSPPLHDLERVLDQAARLRDAGQLVATTMQLLAEGLERPQDTAPLHSILRAA